MLAKKLKFQQWVLGSIALLVIVFIGVFLTTVVRSFNAVSEVNAKTQFALLVEQGTDQLNQLIRQNGAFVAMHVGTDTAQFSQAGRINHRALVPVFLGSLEANPAVYSHYFGLHNDEFLQVIGIRDNAQIASALKAPAGAYFAVRSITVQPQGQRVERYEFLDQGRTKLGASETAANFSPTGRPWYGLAQSHKGLVVTAPYVFASTSEPGITVAAPLPEGLGVMATDVSLRALDQFLGQLPLPPNGAIALQGATGQVLAFHGEGERFKGIKLAPLTSPDTIDHPILSLLKQVQTTDSSGIATLVGEPYVVTSKHLQTFGSTRFTVQVFAPLSDYTGAFRQAERDVIVVSVLMLTLLLPLSYAGTRRVARALTHMARDSERLKRFDFSVAPRKGDTFIYEINALGDAQVVLQDAIRTRTEALRKSQDKLTQLVDNGIRLGREQNRSVLLKDMLFGARDIAHCQAVSLFLKTEHATLTFAMRTSDDPLPAIEIPLHTPQGQANDKFVVVHATLHNSTVLIDDVYRETRFDLSGTKRFSEESGLRTVSMLTVPLSPRKDEVIGAIQLINAMDPETGSVVPFAPELVTFVEALAAQSAVALENLTLIEGQKAIMDALIKLIAGAIDAKSPYTGGHCERVPELGVMLAEAACAVDQGALAEFSFKSDDEWREFRIGAWLHDCGKVTTPEYVVDKATKLETIYNRIHEVRMRFEVLLRDARIGQLEALAQGADPVQVQADFEARRAQLQTDFAFLADCNLGGEFMAPDKVDRLKAMAQTTWLRHFDDRLGLAHEEVKRYPNPAPTLPVAENLLSDKAQHVIPRLNTQVADPKWGFKVKVPEHLYNYGEVYNLSVSRGTLSEEERFKINEHVMQSLMMLQQLPLPKNLRRVPEYAATHHETLLGTGYPRKLTGAELSVPMRIMAIADIFEALTASDRPYKKPKTLSESIKILSFFKKDRHIDADLFDLFLTSGVYRRYAEKYLMPEQIDDVDISRFVG
ncbi:MAG: GAF domain-containing protein [Rhodoferax sp.]|nr:GAF domain-containing protein [Rhodoferax sp.]